MHARSDLLGGPRSTLRTVEPDDYAFVHRHWDDLEIGCGTCRTRPQRRADVRAFFEDEDEDAGDDVDALLPCRDGTPVGLLWVFDFADV